MTTRAGREPVERRLQLKRRESSCSFGATAAREPPAKPWSRGDYVSLSFPAGLSEAHLRSFLPVDIATRYLEGLRKAGWEG